MKPDDPNISIEMISSFMEDMTPKQLEKLCDYAAKLYSDKRYKNGKGKDRTIPIENGVSGA
jgi:hypothetical protein